MIRRAFLKGVAAMPFGTSRAQGFNQQIIAAFQAGNVILNKKGLFVYSGPPANGNLLLSVAVTAGTERYGNAYQGGGAVVYGSNGSAVGVQSFSGVPEFRLYTQNAHVTNSPVLGAQTLGEGTSSEQQVVTLSSGTESGEADAALQLFSESADGTSFSPFGLFEFGGQAGLYFTTAGAIANEPGDTATQAQWHTITNPAGVTGTIRVKALADAKLAMIDINCTITSTLVTANSYTTVGSFPANFPYPKVARQYAASVNQLWSSTANASPRIQIPTSGGIVLQMPAFNAAGNACIVSLTQEFPLD